MKATLLQYVPCLKRVPHEFPLCEKDAMLLYGFTECVCGILEIVKSLPAAWVNDLLALC